MEVTVKLNYLRIAPRKVGQVANLVRGKKVGEAEAILGFLVNRPAKSVLKLLKSATAAAKHNFQLEPANLYISKIFVNEGPKLKRWRPVSRGSAHPLWKRVSHITLILDEIKPSAKKKKRKKAEEVKEMPVKAEKVEEIKEIPMSQGDRDPGTGRLGAAKKEEVLIKKEKPRLERKELKKQKRPGIFKRVFRRKAM